MAASSSIEKTLITALNDKYNDTGDRETINYCEIYVPAGAPGKSDGGFRVPENLALEAYDITHAGDASELADHCSKVRELDLINNKLSDWDQVFAILDGIPLLTFLNLSRNPLSQLTELPADKLYPKLTKLALNFTNLSWSTLSCLLVIFPSLEELYVSGNSYEDILLNIPAYPSLRLLQLTSNKLSNWSHILKLDQLFPSLDNLVLAENPVSNCGSVEDNSGSFSKLTLLNMNNTKICEWNELDKLAAIKSMEDIRLAGIPLVENIKSSKIRTQLLSVHLPHLTRLNGGTISPGELEASETVYLRHFKHEADKPNIYRNILERHGPLQDLAEVDLKPKFSACVHVVSGDKKIQMDVPLKQSVGQFRRSIKQFVGSSKFLMYINRNYGGPREFIANYSLNRLLSSMSIDDNDSFLCVRTDIPIENDDHAQPISVRHM